MVTRAEAKYSGISPSKARLVTRLIKGQTIANAFAILRATNKSAAMHLEKLLKSALSNAKNKGYEEDSLFISKAIANCGPALKRFRAASFGRATMIKKRTSHLLIELDSSEKLLEGVKEKP